MEPDQCRFCFRQDETVINDLVNCIEIVKNLTQMEFLVSDRLPEKVCSECINRLFDANAIREICIASEEMLRSQLDSIEAIDGDETKAGLEFARNDHVDTELENNMEYLMEHEIKEEPTVIEIDEVFTEGEEYVEEIIEESGSKFDMMEQVDETETETEVQKPKERKKQTTKCCQCKVNLGGRNDIDPHMIAYHTGARLKNSPRVQDSNFNCRCCWLEFASAHERDMHVQGRTVRKRESLTYTCEECGTKHTSEIDFYRHQETVHGAEFHCEMCQKTFGTAKQYYTHVHAVHKAGVFVCDLCGQSFNRRYMLEDHKNIHNNIRPFTCSVCNASFSRKTVLRSHYRCHTGEKPYKCEHCEKAFSFATDLKRHSVVHTGKYLYECGICSKGFNRKKTAMDHIALCETGTATKSGAVKKEITREYS